MQARLLALDSSHPLLILSESAEQRWGLGGFVAEFSRGRSVSRLSHCPQNPTFHDVGGALRALNRAPVDAIVAFGGGSALDMAKAICAFYRQGAAPCDEDILAGIQGHAYRAKESFVPLIAIPSTAGTGSEITRWATVWDLDNNKKYSIDAPQLKPVLALEVPELTLSLSASMTLSTGLDALCQAVESYWAKATNPLVQQIALQAIALITAHLEATLAKPSQVELRQKMCLGSTLAAVAFSHTRTTACHSISYPLTMRFGVPHGFAAALTLGAVSEWNRGHFANEDALFALFAPFGGVQAYLDKAADGIQKMRLSAFGVTEADLPALAESSFTAGRMDNNPAEISQKDVQMLLHSVL